MRPNVHCGSGSRSTIGYWKTSRGAADQRGHVEPVEPEVGERGRRLLGIGAELPVLLRHRLAVGGLELGHPVDERAALRRPSGARSGRSTMRRAMWPTSIIVRPSKERLALGDARATS